jgi:hypothetical protein
MPDHLHRSTGATSAPALRRLLAAAALLGLVAAPVAARAAWGDGARIISPAGMGPQYTGFTGATLGLGSEDAPSYGVRVGDFVLLPRLFVMGTYTSNFFRVDERTLSGRGNATETGAFLLQLRPGVGLYNPNFTKVALSMALDADIYLPLTGGEAATDQMNVGGTATVDATFFPKGALTFSLHELFQRDIWMRATAERGNANRNHNSAGATVSLHPGGGALDFSLGYRFEIDRYDQISVIDRDAHALRFMGSWRFYPLTYLFLESSFSLADYPNRPADASTIAGNYVSGMPFKVYAGLSGYLTERLSVLVRAGYGNSFLNEDTASDNFESFIGLLQVSYRFTERTILHVGAARDYEMYVFGGYRTFVRGYLSLSQRIAELATINIDGSFDWRQYGTWSPYPYEVSGTGGVVVTPVPSAADRGDYRVRAGLMADFNVHRLFGITVGYRLDWVISDYNITTVLPTAFTQQFLGYQEHKAYVSLNLRY